MPQQTLGGGDRREQGGETPISANLWMIPLQSAWSVEAGECEGSLPVRPKSLATR